MVNGLLHRVADEMGYSAGGGRNHLVDVLEEMLRRVDDQQEKLEGRDADRLAELADDFRNAPKDDRYAAPSALKALQAEGRLSLVQVAAFIGVEPMDVAKVASPENPEQLLAADELLQDGALSYKAIAQRVGMPYANLWNYAQGRGYSSPLGTGKRVAAAVHARVAELRRAGNSLTSVERILKAEGTPLSRTHISKIGKAAGIVGAVGAVA